MTKYLRLNHHECGAYTFEYIYNRYKTILNHFHYKYHWLSFDDLTSYYGETLWISFNKYKFSELLFEPYFLKLFHWKINNLCNQYYKEFKSKTKFDCEELLYVNDFYNISEILISLNKRQKNILLLKDKYGYTFKEISGMLKLSRQTIYREYKSMKEEIV